MPHTRGHTIHQHQHHFVWDNKIEPVLRVSPGETIAFEVNEASAGVITPHSSAADILKIDTGRVNPVTGPVYVEGAEPGDTLVVRLRAYDPSGWGWTALIPGFGLLADQFPDPALHIWHYDRSGAEPALFGEAAKIPVRPFAGTVGVAQAAPGAHPMVPPGPQGGNLDARDLVAGAVLYLPVAVPGALFSIGDTHAAQGDGEVCGTAIESPMDVALELDLIKATAGRFPHFTTPHSGAGEAGAHGWVATTGIGPDLHTAARDAVAGMIDLLCAQEGLTPEMAYMLCSVTGDLKISEIVNAPNMVVSFYFPRSVFL